MNDEAASSSAAPLASRDSGASPPSLQERHVTDSERDDPAADQVVSKDRQLRAKAKRIGMLEDLLRGLDFLVYVELMTVYYMDCSFLLFVFRALCHLSYLTPRPPQLPDPEDRLPYIGTIVGSNTLCFLLHLFFLHPGEGSETMRGYISGGLAIDFIGFKGPTSRVHLILLDSLILFFQLTMLSIHLKRIELRKRLRGTNNVARPTPTTSSPRPSSPLALSSSPDLDALERGAPARTASATSLTGLLNADTVAGEAELVDSSSRPSTDLLDALNSGQTTIVNVYLLDTIREQYKLYQEYRERGQPTGAASGSFVGNVGDGFRARLRGAAGLQGGV